MKKVLLDSNKNYYKANMHCHSTYSDGKQRIEEIKEDYLKEGYSVVAFTDHEFLMDNSHLSDENFLAITSCEIAIKQIANMSTFVKRDMKVCHLNLYSMNEHNVNTPCYNSVYDHFSAKGEAKNIVIPKTSYERVYGAEGINEIIKKATDEGFLVAYNHPRWSLETARDYLEYKGLWAVEIFNTSCWRNGYFEYDINTYDDFLREGEKIACVAGDDNHGLDDRFGGHIMINAEKLDYATIMNALKNHDFYASTGARINGLYVEGKTAHISVPKGKYVVMTTGIRRTEIKELSKEADLNDIKFEITDADKYIRFDVADEDGKRANTCAYFI